MEGRTHVRVARPHGKIIHRLHSIASMAWRRYGPHGVIRSSTAVGRPVMLGQRRRPWAGRWAVEPRVRYRYRMLRWRGVVVVRRRSFRPMTHHCSVFCRVSQRHTYHGGAPRTPSSSDVLPRASCAATCRGLHVEDIGRATRRVRSAFIADRPPSPRAVPRCLRLGLHVMCLRPSARMRPNSCARSAPRTWLV